MTANYERARTEEIFDDEEQLTRENITTQNRKQSKRGWCIHTCAIFMIVLMVGLLTGRFSKNAPHREPLKDGLLAGRILMNPPQLEPFEDEIVVRAKLIVNTVHDSATGMF